MSLLDLLMGVLLLATGFLAVRLKNAVHAALALAANFVLVGVVYMLLEARFLGWIQIIVYAGAIMVLFVFVIMLLYAAQAEVGADPLPALPPPGTAEALGPVIWQTWLYAVLLVAALLLVATVAAVTVLRPGEGGVR